MSFVPQFPIEPMAVFGSLRVGLQNNVHSAERVADVTLDTMSDLAHQTTVFANAGVLSLIEMQQAMLSARNCQDAWKLFADHGNRLRDEFFKYVEECFACRHRAMDRLYAEDGYAGH